MKVVRIITRLNVGGPAQHVVWLGAGLRRLGHDEVLVCGSVPPGEHDMRHVAEKHGVDPVVIPELSRELSPRDALVVWKLFRLFVQERPDVVHTHTAKAGAVGRAAALLYGLYLRIGFSEREPPKVFHTFHGHVFHSYYGRLRTWIFLTVERALARLTHRIIVISDQQLDEISRRFRIGHLDQFAVVRLGVDLDRFRRWPETRTDARKQLGLEPTHVAVAIIGRLTGVKNHGAFLAAAAWLERERPTTEWRFLIVGDGELRRELESQVDSLGLRGAVFLGNRNDVESLYPAFDIVALTSLNEGTPVTLIEAMASGRPFVSTAVGGVVDLAGEPLSNVPSPLPSVRLHTHGVLVHGKDSMDVAGAIAFLGAEPCLRQDMGIQGERFVQQHYSVARLVRDVARLYNQVSRATIGELS